MHSQIPTMIRTEKTKLAKPLGWRPPGRKAANSQVIHPAITSHRKASLVGFKKPQLAFLSLWEIKISKNSKFLKCGLFCGMGLAEAMTQGLDLGATAEQTAP